MSKIEFIVRGIGDDWLGCANEVEGKAVGLSTAVCIAKSMEERKPCRPHSFGGACGSRVVDHIGSSCGNLVNVRVSFAGLLEL